MRRFGRLAALAMLAGRPTSTLSERIAARRAGLNDGSESTADPGRFELPSGVSLEPDVAYGSDAAQRFDVYRPAGSNGAPVILFVHGGGWRRGDKSMPQMVRNKVAHWARKGVALVSTNYRMLPAAGVLEQAEDVSRALAFVQHNAARWGGDASRVVLMGHSAGAHLVALVTADSHLASDAGVQPWLATVAIDSAALDIEAIMRRAHYRFYDPVFGTDPTFWRAASPMHRLNAKPVAPMLLVCSSMRQDSCPPSREFAAKANAFGGCVTVLPVAQSHLQINDQLGVRGEYTEAVDTFLRSVGLF
jgi:arylformamidase